jgi:hypothetical protein
MIKQSREGLISRSEAYPFSSFNNMLPLITAPMYSVVNNSNKQEFIDEKIQVCLPREDKVIITNLYFPSTSLDFFENHYLKSSAHILKGMNRLNIPYIKVCIDTANGNNPDLLTAINMAKKKYEDKIVIMSGNVSSLDAFISLAKSGCDYIRVGIGGGDSCNTTLQTGVGQKNLEKLIHKCFTAREYDSKNESMSKVRIVADGISSYVDKLVQKKEGLDNGYAAINRLLYAGADLIMIGKLFTQALESAGQKYINDLEIEKAFIDIPNTYDDPLQFAYQFIKKKTLYVDYYGMSSLQAQSQYSTNVKPSEGSFKSIPVKWKLHEWLYGNNTNELPGWVNTLKSAMAYTGVESLRNFKKR